MLDDTFCTESIIESMINRCVQQGAQSGSLSHLNSTHEEEKEANPRPAADLRAHAQCNHNNCVEMSAAGFNGYFCVF